MTVRDAVAELAQASSVDDELPELPELGRREPEPGSLLAAVRDRARALSAITTVDLELPGYSGTLWGRYAAVSIAKTMSADTVNPLIPSWEVAADVLARALVGLYGRTPGGELQSLQLDVETRFDDDLVEMLDLQPTERTARGVLVALLGGGELGESRVSAHFMAYQGWLLGGEGDQTSEVVGRVMGESRAR